MSKHTPGQWKAADTTMAGEQYISAGNQIIGRAHRHTDQCANALIMAAAPDLLEALEAFMRDSDKHNWPHTCACFTCQGARKAIAKAKGEEGCQ